MSEKKAGWIGVAQGVTYLGSTLLLVGMLFYFVYLTFTAEDSNGFYVGLGVVILFFLLVVIAGAVRAWRNPTETNQDQE